MLSGITTRAHSHSVFLTRMTNHIDGGCITKMIVLPKNTQRNGKINRAYEDSIDAVSADDLLDFLHRLFRFNNRYTQDQIIRGLEILTSVKAEDARTTWTIPTNTLWRIPASTDQLASILSRI